MIKKYTVLFFNEEDEVVAKWYNVGANDRKDAMWSVVNNSTKELPKWRSWDAIEEKNIQPRLFPEEEARDCVSWKAAWVRRGRQHGYPMSKG